MDKYKPTIGLEIHAELNTKTKMFCDSKNDPNESNPNVNTCPVCLAHPGTLPVINKEAVKSILKIGLALDAKLADFSEFDRKNYFYPDIPKGYQISQYKYPLVEGGSLNGISITRVHLEEDTARSTHTTSGGSLLDFNRAGVPLMELVTEPVIKDAEEAMLFAKELQLLLRTLGVAEANMEKGEMRVEANISVSKDENFGTKVEVKNLNSFKVVAKAIEYEIKRQVDVLENGGEVVQETRGYDDVKGETFSQRIKETSADYRYFPEPDLPKLQISEIPEFSKENLSKELPELPWQKRERLINDYKIKKEDAEMYLYDRALSEIFETTASKLNDASLIKLSSNYLSSDLVGLSTTTSKRPDHIFGQTEKFAESFSKLILMIDSNELSSRGAKDVLKEMFENGGEPDQIAVEKNLKQESDEGVLEQVVESVMVENQEVVNEYKNGKENALQYLVGQAMKKTKGTANPKALQDIFKKKIT